MSQDRRQIINFDKTTNLWIDDNEINKENKLYEIYADGELLASYQTEKKAIKVLDEIFATIKFKYGNTFTMPED